MGRNKYWHVGRDHDGQEKIKDWLVNKCQEKVDSKPSKDWFVTALYLSDIRELKMGVQTGHYKAWKGKKILHKGARDSQSGSCWVRWFTWDKYNKREWFTAPVSLPELALREKNSPENNHEFSSPPCRDINLLWISLSWCCMEPNCFQASADKNKLLMSQLYLQLMPH